MANPNKQNSIPEDNTNGVDRLDESLEELSSVDVPSVDVEPSSVGSVDNLSVLRVNGSSGCETGFTERLTNILVDDGDGDLLLQQNDRETRVLQWLQALDLQVLGACRADERMKPLLKLNVSSGAAEDRLLAHLSQHFDPSEVGKLARCLCIPLVSIRVGKISKQGTLLCPTATRNSIEPSTKHFPMNPAL